MSDMQKRFSEEVDKIGVTSIARELGVARNTVYNWIAKGNAPLNYVAILTTLGVDIVYVLAGDVLGRNVTSKLTEMLRVTAKVEPSGGLVTDGAVAAIVEEVEQAKKREQALLANYRASSEQGKQALETAAIVMAERAAGDKE